MLTLTMPGRPPKAFSSLLSSYDLINTLLDETLLQRESNKKTQ